MHVWVTKYALTAGILEVPNAEVFANGTAVSWQSSDGPWSKMFAHGEGKDWHRTRESAVVRAHEMRAAKLKSIAKQVKKLEALTF